MIKKQYPWVFQILIAIALALWFDGINMITRTFFEPSRKIGMAFCAIALIIFLIDDGKLNELHSIEHTGKNNKKPNKVAAIMSAINN